jgi:hypothetical protein
MARGGGARSDESLSLLSAMTCSGGARSGDESLLLESAIDALADYKLRTMHRR